jgi:DNA-binding transcriptional LysR family regulator
MSKLPDFEGLAMFAKVAEERSFAAAARAMGVSVATVSRGVSRLEERLGARLFNRTSRRLALTDFGHTLAERATRIYCEAEDAENAARELSSQPRGLIRLAVPMSSHQTDRCASRTPMLSVQPYSMASASPNSRSSSPANISPMAGWWQS